MTTQIKMFHPFCEAIYICISTTAHSLPRSSMLNPTKTRTELYVSLRFKRYIILLCIFVRTLAQELPPGKDPEDALMYDT
jgi:hypothetical protein